MVDKIFKILAYILVAIGIGVLLCGGASIFLPETSAPSILYDKLKYLGWALFLTGYVIILQIENKNLRLRLRDKK